MLERVLVEQRLGLARTQQRQLPGGRARGARPRGRVRSSSRGGLIAGSRCPPPSGADAACNGIAGSLDSLSRGRTEERKEHHRGRCLPPDERRREERGRRLPPRGRRHAERARHRTRPAAAAPASRTSRRRARSSSTRRPACSSSTPAATTCRCSRSTPDGLALLDRVASGGTMPTSIAVRDSRVFVLNAGGDANVTGFTLEGDSLEPSGDTRALPGADPAQIGFTPDGSALDRHRPRDRLAARAAGRRRRARRGIASSGATPYGFDFTRDGTLVVTEAFGGTVGAAAARRTAPGSRRSARASRTRAARSAGPP